MAYRWFAIDRDGFIAVCESVRIPESLDDPEGGDDATRELVAVLRLASLPTRGIHAGARGGAVLMLANEDRVRRETAHVEPVTREVIAARFPPPRRGRAARFQQSVRSFGQGDERSVLERLHDEGACDGCTTRAAEDKLGISGLLALGLHVYLQDDDDANLLQRVHQPPAPLALAMVAALEDRWLRVEGAFAECDLLALEDFGPPR